MPTTTTKGLTDTNVHKSPITANVQDRMADFEVTVKDVLPLVAKFATNRHKDLWAMADRMFEYAEKHPIANRVDLGEPLREAYRRHFKFPKGSDSRESRDADYHNFTEWVSKLALIAHYYSRTNVLKKEYQKWRESGKGVYHVHQATKDKGKKLKEPKKEDISKKALQNEAAKGVINTEEYAKVTESKDKPNTKANEKKATSWTSEKARGGSNFADKEWKRATKEIIEGEIQKFYQLVVDLASKGALSEEWLKLAEKELEELGS